MDLLTLSGYLATLVTICVLTYVWKENIAFRIVEHTYIGLASGYALVRAISVIDSTAFRPMVDSNQFFWIVILVIGVLYLTRLLPQYSYMSRWPAAIVAGVGYGVAIRGIIGASIVEQLAALIKPATTPDMVMNVNIFLGLVLCSAALFYYVFTVEPKGIISWIPKIGIAVYMITFGGSIGFELQGRISYLVERLQAILITFGVS